MIIAMVVSVFAARLFQLQGVDASVYAARAAAEGMTTVTLPANRGGITDRNGAPLADSVDGLMIVADPTMTAPHAKQIATILARRLDLDYVDVLDRLRQPDTHFQYLARRVPATEARAVVDEVQARGFDGLDTRRDPVRDYPAGDVAANLVGFMNDQGDAAEGAELNFDHLLSGKDGTATYEMGGGNRIPLGDSNVVPAHSGHNLALTIDRDVQWYAQRALRTAVQGSGGDWGSAVVMDTHTGELLAVADYPTFDASRPAEASPTDLGSRSLRDAYEPGSVEKVLTTSALIDAGKV
ncbi:MAG: penicillin-binding transpeptidase domain-containing protein, partial [Kineosporiaceae bacterium]